MKELPYWRLWWEDNRRAIVIVGVVVLIALVLVPSYIRRDPCRSRNGFPNYWTCFKSACSADPALQALCTPPARPASVAPFYCGEKLRIHTDGAVTYRGRAFGRDAAARKSLETLVADDRKQHPACPIGLAADPGTDFRTIMDVARLAGVSKIGIVTEPISSP